MTTENLTIMFTDIKGFTQRVSAGTRDEVARIRTIHDGLLTPVITHYNGQIVKTIGDAFMVKFGSPTDAVLCGLAIQSVLKQHNETAEENDQLEVRVAINAGEVDVAENDVLGEPVNIAARLEGIAEAGEVFFTEVVYLAMNRKEAPSAEVGERIFKGIPYPVKIYKALQDHDNESITTFTNQIISGQRTPAPTATLSTAQYSANNKSNRGVYTALLSIAALIAALSILAPDYSQQNALTKAHTLIERERHLDAFNELSEFYANPVSSEVITTGEKAASAYIQSLMAKQDFASAAHWLVTARAQYPQLNLSEVESSITTQKYLHEIKQVDTSAQYSLTNDWLTKYSPTRTELKDVLLARAGAIEPRAGTLIVKQIISSAATEQEDVVNQYWFTVMQHYPPYGVTDQLHDILIKHDPDAAIAWAKSEITGSHPVAIRNASRILKETNAQTFDASYINLLVSLAKGYTGQKAAERARTNMLKVEDKTKQQQLLQLHANIEVLHKTLPTWKYVSIGLTRENHNQLKQDWM